MQVEFVKKQGSARLLLIFSGWGTDARPFRSLAASGYDIAVAYDYRSMCFEKEVSLDNYEEVCVLAWSFGVPAAAWFIKKHPELPRTATVAVNGTLYPVDDRRGIPRAVFDGTLGGLSAATLRKFDRRMCGSAAVLAEYDKVHPQRDPGELADELRTIDSLMPSEDMALEFDTVYVSDSDRIIPTGNQIEAWAGHADVRIVEGPHLPDFGRIIRTVLTDKSLVASRFGASASSYNSEAKAQRHIARHLSHDIVERLRGRHPGRVIEVGAGTGMLTNLLSDYIGEGELELWDLAAMSDFLPGRQRICDAETAIRHVAAGSLGMVVSASAVQWFNSPRAFIGECFRSLSPGGLLAFSTFGPENFCQLRDYLPSTPHYLSAQSWSDLLERQGWTDIRIYGEKIDVGFESPRKLVEHLRLTGVNALSPAEKGITSLRRIMADGIHSLTYVPLYILACKPE